MPINRYLLLASASIIALTADAAAQERNNTKTTVLETITVVSAGEENSRATGGTVITMDDLDKLRATNVSELFARQSSVTVSGGGGPSKRIHVFGMEQSNLAVTVDGVPQIGTSWHHTGSSVIDPVFLKRVEVEAGAAAADSGFAAAAGAVRYETVNAVDLLEDGKDLGARIGMSYGSNGRGLSTNAAGYGRTKYIDWLIMGHTANGHNYKSGNGTEMRGTEPAAKNIISKFGVEVEDNRFELGYEKSRDEADRLIKMNLTQASDAGAPLKVERESVNLKYSTTAATDLWDPEALIYHTTNDYRRPNYSTSRTNGNMLLEERMLGGKLQNTFTLDAGKITAGLDILDHDYHIDSYANTTSRYRDFSTTQLGLFTQGRFEFDNGFKISTGARLDHHRFNDWDDNEFTDSGASFNGTIAYRFNDNVEVFAGASRTWLGYQLRDYAYLHARNNTFSTDPDFEASTARNYKIGANFGANDWTAGVTLFDTTVDGIPVYGTATPNYKLYNSPEDFRSRGVTLNANYLLGDTTFGATFTHAKVTYGGLLALPNGSTFMPVGSSATFYIDHEMPDYNLKLGGSVAWAGKIPAISNPGPYGAGSYKEQPSYAVVNIYTEWTPPQYENLSLRVGIDNLFNKNYFERSGFPENAAGTLEPALAPGRTFTAHAKLKF